MDQTIVAAVMQRRTLSFRYGGEVREVEPHCYGCDKQGHDAIRAFQHGGKGWRLFHVSEASGLTLGKDTFQPRPDYRHNDSAMMRIYAQV